MVLKRAAGPPASAKAPVAPGSIASAYGNFASVTTTALSSLNPMPTTLANLRLTVGGVNAPLYFVSANQINFVVPVGTAIGSAPVEVINGSTTVARGNVNIYDFWPALATAGTDPTRPAIAQNQDFGINSRTTRARRKVSARRQSNWSILARALSVSSRSFRSRRARARASASRTR